MDSNSLWKALGHIATAVVKNGENKPSGHGDRRAGSAPGSFGEAGGVRIKLGTATTTPCCIAKRKGQK